MKGKLKVVFFVLACVALLVLATGCAQQSRTRFVMSPKECRQAGGVLVCDHWGDCDCVDRGAVMIFQ